MLDKQKNYLWSSVYYVPLNFGISVMSLPNGELLNMSLNILKFRFHGYIIMSRILNLNDGSNVFCWIWR